MGFPQRGLHLVYLYADSPTEWNCSQWRALTPADAINSEREAGRTYHTAQLFQLPTALDWNHTEVQKKIGKADIIVFQRNVIVPEVWAAMDYWRALHKLVVVDLDDHYPDLPPSNPAHQYWIVNVMNLKPDPITALTEALKHSDAVTSPSKVILEDWSHVVSGYWTPNWAMRKWYEGLEQKPLNAPDVEFSYQGNEKNYQFLTKHRADSEGWITLGWGGSISHVDSWLYSNIVPALDRLFEKWPNVRLKFCGSETRLDDLMLKRWGERVIRQQGVKPEHWPLVVSTFDIGLAPLDTRPLDPPWRDGAPLASYDERRSYLKGVEYLCAGVPWIGSKSRTYDELSHLGTLVRNDAEDWFYTLNNKVEHLAAEKHIAWERRRWALKKLTFEPNVNKYVSIFERAMAEKVGKSGAQLPGVIYVPKIILPETQTVAEAIL